MHIGHFDGACQPNPGELGLGACILDENGVEVAAVSAYREFGTNNQAEYLSLILLLKSSIKLGVRELKCFGDSDLIIKQVTGTFQASQKFLPYLTEIGKLAPQFSSLSFHWVRREENVRADQLSKMGLDSKSVRPFVHINAFESTRPHEAPLKLNETPYSQPSKLNRVTYLGNYLISIQERQNVAVLDVKSMQCSCVDFKKKASCKHTEVALPIRHTLMRPTCKA